MLGFLELMLLGLLSPSKCPCDDKVTVTPDPALAVSLILLGAVIVPRCRLEVGSEVL